MGDEVANGTSSDTIVVSEAFTAARELLRLAEEDAAGMRADADRYVRQREQEAELLVAKARRLLAVAEGKAASVAAASPAPVVIDLDAPLPVDDPSFDDEPVRPGVRRSRNELDSILATAIGNAIHRALPADR